jgi:hypothetical protein
VTYCTAKSLFGENAGFGANHWRQAPPTDRTVNFTALNADEFALRAHPDKLFTLDASSLPRMDGHAPFQASGETSRATFGRHAEVFQWM